MHTYHQPQIETMPPEELRKLQDERLTAQVKHVYESVPHYRQLQQPGCLLDRGNQQLRPVIVAGRMFLHFFVFPVNQLFRTDGRKHQPDLPFSQLMLFQVQALEGNSPFLEPAFSFLGVKVFLPAVDLDIHAFRLPPVRMSFPIRERILHWLVRSRDAIRSV